MLWDEEDLARRNAPDAEGARSKRAIDSFDQKRNNAVERLEKQLGTGGDGRIVTIRGFVYGSLVGCDGNQGGLVMRLAVMIG
jgi:hypothetical protein